jgi:hypothetical protein
MPKTLSEYMGPVRRPEKFAHHFFIVEQSTQISERTCSAEWRLVLLYEPIQLIKKID